MSGDRMFPKWITESLADDMDKRNDRIEAMFGEAAAAEGREIVAELRAITEDPA